MDIAFVLCGGNSLPNLYPATVRFTDYAQAALDIGPRIMGAGYTRLMYHNPGGHHYLGWTPDYANVHSATQINQATAAGVNTREMHVNQWLLAEQSQCPFADRVKLKVGHKRLLQDFGIEEVIYYLGDPTVLHNVKRDAPPCVEMFLDCGPGVSLAFDAVAWDTAMIVPGDPTCDFFDKLRRMGVKVYAEPRLNEEQAEAGLGLYLDGVIATETFDTDFSPDLAIQPGEVIRGPIPAATSVPGGVTRLVYDVTDQNWT